MLEEERNYDVSPVFALPDLRAAAPTLGRVVEQPAVTLRSTYYDTADLRLTRAGVVLRRRRGEGGLPWVVELPWGESRARREITAKLLTSRGLSSRIPDELARLVLAYTRGAPLSAAVTLETNRRMWQICDTDGRGLLDLLDDTVTVLDGRRAVSRFRGLTAQLKEGDRRLLEHVDLLLAAAGAAVGSSAMRPVRALGPLASEPSDLPAPPELASDSSAADVLIAELRRQLAQLTAHDPVVRLDPGGLDGVDKLLGACRRLQVDLQAFAPLFATPPATAGRGTTIGSPHPAADPLTAPLGRFSDSLHAVTTPHLLRDRLGKPGDSGSSTTAHLDRDVLARVDATLAGAAARATHDLANLLASPAHTALLDGLIATARAPRLRQLALESATEILPVLAATFWARLTHAVEKLDLEGAVADWQATRIAAWRLERLARLAVPSVGEPARLLVDALAPSISHLDAEREAQQASAAWLGASDAMPGDRPLAVVVGRLIEREHVRVCAARQAFRSTWQEQQWSAATGWLV